MTRSTTLAALIASTLAAVTAPASAGCGGGGGFSVSFGGGGGHYRHHAPIHRTPVRHTPVYHAPVHRAPVHRIQPIVTQPLAPQQVIQQPVIQQPVQQPTVAPQQVAPAASPEQSALNALMAFGGQPAAALQQQSTHVGVWTATVNGSNRVSLQLDASGAFRWTANSGGKTSSFAGSYTITNGQLTLVRGDNQQLAGAWTADATGGFRFKLASASDNGLLFVRG